MNNQDEIALIIEKNKKKINKQIFHLTFLESDICLWFPISPPSFKISKYIAEFSVFMINYEYEFINFNSFIRLV